MDRLIVTELRNIAHHQKHIEQCDEKVKNLEIRESRIRTKKRGIYIKRTEIQKEMDAILDKAFARESNPERKRKDD